MTQDKQKNTSFITVRLASPAHKAITEVQKKRAMKTGVPPTITELCNEAVGLLAAREGVKA